MPFDYPTAVSKPYHLVPVPRDFIPSRPPPPTSSSISHHEPEKAAQAQEPEKAHILWVGCSDSLMIETETLDVRPQEMFVHRNLGNVMSNGDLSSRAAVEWGVEVLGVDDIVICGHYDCALIDECDRSELGGWHKNIAKLHELTETHLLEKSDVTLDEETRHRKLEEVYVLAEVDWLKRQECVKRAMKERGLRVRGLVFDRVSGGCLEVVEG